MSYCPDQFSDKFALPQNLKEKKKKKMPTANFVKFYRQ